ncbi:MAG: hypothetical protein Q8N22_02065 [bacterium]|nr:hypothetical protein [bacterium]
MNLKNKILFLFILSSFCFLLSVLSATAQTASQVLITWQAQSFVPAEYQGKILPASGTNIKLGLELVITNKIQDLSKADIFWYLDGKLLGRGQGLKQINFTATKGATNSHFVRAAVNYNQQEYDGTADIPIANPKIVIQTPSPANNSIPLGKKNDFQAIPYFFNINNLGELLFTWLVNGQTFANKGDNLLGLTLTPPIPSNQNINIKITAQNLKNDLELGSKEINLNVQQ